LSSRKQISEDELLQLLLKKNSKGFEILYDNYSAILYGIIYRTLQDHRQAEEVLKDLFVKIGMNISQYNPTRHRFSFWLIQMARKASLEKSNQVRVAIQSKYENIDVILSQSASGIMSPIHPELSGIREVIEKMDEEYRQVLYLMFYAGLTQSEIALKLNIPLGTVKTRSRMALMRLRTYFEKHKEVRWI
jgi:RNA polymerase sigma factor (sigma-70 family)